jgi:hypothetical protein
MRLFRTHSRPSFAILIALGALVHGAGHLYSDDRPSQKAVRRSRAFLDSAENGQYVLSFDHMGAQYRGHEYSGTIAVTTQSGTTLAGHFALVYEYSWEDDGHDKIAFLCDQRGNVYEVQVLKSNGELSRPFVFAKVSIDVLGSALLEAFKDNISKSDRAKLQTMINNSDPKSILELGLKLRQTFGG